MTFPHHEHKEDFMNGCQFLPSYSCHAGYLSSDSNDDEECCEPRLQAFYMDQGCCAESVNPNLSSQIDPKQRHINPRAPSRLLTPKINFRDNQMENVAFPRKDLGSNSQQTGHTAQFTPPQTQSSELCKCKKTSNDTRDAGTQTDDNTAVACDASTQCSAEDNLCPPPPPVDVSVQHAATGRQSDTTAEPSTHTPSSAKGRSGGKHTPRTKKKSRAGSPSGSINECAANGSYGPVIPQRPINPFVDVSITDGRDKENKEGRDERAQRQKDLSDEVREEVTSATGANTLSEEAETLQEIADILHLLKQRK
ncbi:uncharacterized protein LOC121961100 [Plectropomus leopardus]|uniref:uncharacterized protein LOC121961100 n=1 Tax=Plectropomus leopardus TaxID=160734 RepID=UPI001C4C128B|nr:uncharacterized protein LOC121961100 [Plectropomus leopardus]